MEFDVRWINLLPDDSRANELMSAEGKLAKDVTAILNNLKATRKTTSDITKIEVSDDKKTLNITLDGIVHPVTLDQPIESRRASVHEIHFDQLAGIYTNRLYWRYSAE